MVGGTFRRVRNPGYVAVVGILLGEALLLGSNMLLAYAAGIWLLFYCFVLLYEEPTLRRQFGEGVTELLQILQPSCRHRACGDGCEKEE